VGLLNSESADFHNSFLATHHLFNNDLISIIFTLLFSSVILWDYLASANSVPENATYLQTFKTFSLYFQGVEIPQEE
jgi:hypothetical protein